MKWSLILIHLCIKTIKDQYLDASRVITGLEMSQSILRDWTKGVAGKNPLNNSLLSKDIFRGQVWKDLRRLSANFAEKKHLRTHGKYGDTCGDISPIWVLIGGVLSRCRINILILRFMGGSQWTFCRFEVAKSSFRVFFMANVWDTIYLISYQTAIRFKDHFSPHKWKEVISSGKKVQI